MKLERRAHEGSEFSSSREYPARGFVKGDYDRTSRWPSSRAVVPLAFSGRMSSGAGGGWGEGQWEKCYWIVHEKNNFYRWHTHTYTSISRIYYIICIGIDRYAFSVTTSQTLSILFFTKTVGTIFLDPPNAKNQNIIPRTVDNINNNHGLDFIKVYFLRHYFKVLKEAPCNFTTQFKIFANVLH